MGWLDEGSVTGSFWKQWRVKKKKGERKGIEKSSEKEKEKIYVEKDGHLKSYEEGIGELERGVIVSKT